jgi:hypothetical protein
MTTMRRMIRPMIIARRPAVIVCDVALFTVLDTPCNTSVRFRIFDKFNTAVESDPPDPQNRELRPRPAGCKPTTIEIHGEELPDKCEDNEMTRDGTTRLVLMTVKEE